MHILKVFANQANIKILSKGKIKQDYSYDPIDFKIGIYNVNFHNLFKLENLLLKIRQSKDKTHGNFQTSFIFNK